MAIHRYWPLLVALAIGIAVVMAGVHTTTCLADHTQSMHLGIVTRNWTSAGFLCRMPPRCEAIDGPGILANDARGSHDGV